MSSQSSNPDLDEIYFNQQGSNTFLNSSINKMEKSPLPRSSSGKDFKKRQRYERRRATSEDPGKRTQGIMK